MSQKVKIEIPKADEKEVVSIPQGSIGNIRQKFERIDEVIFGIIVVVLLSLLAIIISVIGLFLDQMRFNNAAYRDYSEKIQTVETLKNESKNLHEQNEHNQEIIMTQQKEILELLNKK